AGDHHNYQETRTMAKEPSDLNEPNEAVDPQDFVDASAEAKAEYGRFNLAIIGKSGVGKSSLVNAVFGRDWAQVGKGLPVSQGIRYYSDDSLGIWDVEGFELGSKRP